MKANTPDEILGRKMFVVISLNEHAFGEVMSLLFLNLRRENQTKKVEIRPTCCTYGHKLYLAWRASVKRLWH